MRCRLLYILRTFELVYDNVMFPPKEVIYAKLNIRKTILSGSFLIRISFQLMFLIILSEHGSWLVLIKLNMTNLCFLIYHVWMTITRYWMSIPSSSKMKYSSSLSEVNLLTWSVSAFLKYSSSHDFNLSAFFKFPSLTWSLIGINWLSCHIGKFALY